MHKTLKTHIAKRFGAPVRRRGEHEHQHVHFHRGPQGRPTPCYNERCTSPRLSV